jgi:hypothetical protein
MQTDDELIAAYHSTDAAKAIAIRLGISVRTLTTYWRYLKNKGLIPDKRRSNVVLTDDIGEIPKPPLLHKDPLLVRLHAIHGKDKRRPDGTLVGEMK